MLVFSQKVNTRTSLMYRYPMGEGSVNLDTCVVDLEESMQSAYETSRKRQNTSSK